MPYVHIHIHMHTQEEKRLWNAYHLIIFIIMGVGGGLFGALFNSINARITEYRMKYLLRRHRLWRCVCGGVCVYACVCLHTCMHTNAYSKLCCACVYSRLDYLSLSLTFSLSQDRRGGSDCRSDRYSCVYCSHAAGHVCSRGHVSH